MQVCGAAANLASKFKVDRGADAKAILVEATKRALLAVTLPYLHVLLEALKSIRLPSISFGVILVDQYHLYLHHNHLINSLSSHSLVCLGWSTG